MAAELLVNKPSQISYMGVSFLLLDSPTNNLMHTYLEICRKKHVKAIVCACERTYDTELLANNGVVVIDLPFKDGDVPQDAVLDSFFALLKQYFPEAYNASTTTVAAAENNNNNTPTKDSKCCIGIHCLAGLGRCCTLCAIALIELKVDNAAAIDMIRKKRQKAFNSKQLKFLQEYKPRMTSGSAPCCEIM